MKIGVIVLARSSSRRLPNKHFLMINNKKVIDYIIDKLLIFFEKDQIVIATSNKKEDNQFSIYAKEKNIKVFRGSLENVAERFLNASINFDYSIRINGDNVFLDSKLIMDTLNNIKLGEYNLITNVIGNTYPSGMTIEAFKVSFYSHHLTLINNNSDWREHVSKYFYDNYKSFAGSTFEIINQRKIETKNMKISLDTKEDYELLVKIANQFVLNHINYDMEEIYEIYERIE